MKKRILFIVVFSLIFVCLLNGVYSANSYSTPTIAEGAARLFDFLASVFSKINVSWVYDFNANEVIEFFYGVLLFIIIYYIVDMFRLFDSSKEWLNIVLSVCITMLALIALPEGFYSYIIPSYESMASLFFTVILFFMLFYVSTMSKRQMWGRMIWLFVTILGCVLIFQNGVPDIRLIFKENLFYVGMVIVGILMMIFLPTIREWAFKTEMNEVRSAMRRVSDVENAIRGSRIDEANELSRFSEQ